MHFHRTRFLLNQIRQANYESLVEGILTLATVAGIYLAFWGIAQGILRYI